MIVHCVKSILPTNDVHCPDWYPDVTVGRHYTVLTIEYDSYRLLGDEGKPFLYPLEAFEVVDDTVPSDWVHQSDSSGVCHGPRPLLEPGLFEDYFEGKPEAKRIVETYLARK